MRAFGAASLAVVLLSAQPSSASGRARTAKVFLLDDAANKRWCAYSKEATWNGAVQKVGAVTVGALNYSGDHLLQIDVTETDESGDWTVYDHYVLDDRRQVIRLSRTINVLPEDRSVLQTFSISDGHATRTATTEKRLSTGELRSSPRSAWLPELPILTGTRLFPFSGLLGRSDLTTSGETCARTLLPQK